MTTGLRLERAQAVPFRIPMKDGAHEGALLIVDAAGLQGLGEAAALVARGHDLASVTSGLAEAAGRLGGVELSSAAEIPSLLAAHDPAPVRCAVESALLDLVAQAAQVPLAALLGGVRRTDVGCCELVSERDPARVARAVDAAAARGFESFKLKAAGRGGALDLERLGAARWAGGGTATLRLDFNGALGSEAATVLSSLSPFRLEFVEEPLSASVDLEGWLRVSGGSPVPLLADESLADCEMACGLARGGISLALKLATVGGPLAARALAQQASGAVLLGSSHETSIGIALALQVAAALDVAHACGLATRALLAADLGLGLDGDGPRLALPAGSGLGVSLDAAVLAHYRLDR